jgi:hypothetical protein
MEVIYIHKTYNFKFVTLYSEEEAGSGSVKNINGSGRKAKSSGSERIRIRNTGFKVNRNPLANFVRGSEDTAKFLKEFLAAFANGTYLSEGFKQCSGSVRVFIRIRILLVLQRLLAHIIGQKLIKSFL